MFILPLCVYSDLPFYHVTLNFEKPHLSHIPFGNLEAFLLSDDYGNIALVMDSWCRF